MKINESKNRRFYIMEQISIRQRSKQVQRKSSAQRRRKIQQNLNDFMKTMSNVSFRNTGNSFRNTGNSQGFKYQHPQSQIQKSYEELQRQKQHNNNNKNENKYEQKNKQYQQTPRYNIKKQYDEVLRSPSFKDINIGKIGQQNIEGSIASAKNSNLFNSSHQNYSGIDFNSQLKGKIQGEQDNMVSQQQIKYRNAQRVQKQQNSKENNKQIINKSPKSIIQNQSSASAIFFTSQFNQLISKNHISSKQNLEESNPFNLNKNQKQNNLINKQTLFKQSQQIKISQRKIGEEKFIDAIAQQNQNEQLSKVKQRLITNSQQGQQRLTKNKSGHSLAFSNQSSLKYSLNQSNIKQILNKKFTNQLIADTVHFDPNHQNSSLFYHLKLQIITDKFIHYNVKLFLKQFVLLTKVIRFNKKVKKNQLKTYFQAFLINQQLNLQQKKYQIICDNYLNQKKQKLLISTFSFLKQNFFILPHQKLINAQNLLTSKQSGIKQKVFRCLKIAWFDQKVKKQINLYYLSKLFNHFMKVIKAQKQYNRNKSLTFYCHNLKKRFFNLLKQGVDNLQTQRIQRDNATWHYNFGLQRKVFDAWKDKLSYKDRYISLAMTTKNTFKQTKDQKWLQIKTVDFRQIK